MIWKSLDLRPPKNKEKIMFWTGFVKAWDKSAAAGSVKCDRKQCEKCGRIPKVFECCELRVKTFLILFGGLVYPFEAITLRWRCPLCGYRFTMQPPWGLPRKRYVKGVILSRCWRYLQEAGTTYRSVLAGIGYGRRDNLLAECRR